MTFTGDPSMPRFADTAGLQTIDTALLQLPPERAAAALAGRCCCSSTGRRCSSASPRRFTGLDAAVAGRSTSPAGPTAASRRAASPSRRSRTCRCSATTRRTRPGPASTTAARGRRGRGARAVLGRMITTGDADHRPTSTLTAEVCVIGSGAGGAVVAKELAEAGRDVVAARAGRPLHQGRLHPARRRDDAAALRGHGAARHRRSVDPHPAGPQRRRLDGAQPLLLLPHAGADPREVAARGRRARHVVRPTCCRPSSASSRCSR